MLAKLKSSLIIAAIGHKDSGKTTALVFLLDALWDMGIRDIKDKSSLLTELMESNVVAGASLKPRLILFDDISNEAELNGLKKYNLLLVRIRRGPAFFVEKKFRWIEDANPDLVLINDAELRRFEYTVKDAVKNILPEIKQFKQAIDII